MWKASRRSSIDLGSKLKNGQVFLKFLLRYGLTTEFKLDYKYVDSCCLWWVQITFNSSSFHPFILSKLTTSPTFVNKTITMHLLPTVVSIISLSAGITKAHNIQCFTNANCNTAAGVGAVKTAPESGTYCVNVIGRKSCKLSNHQGPGGGVGYIRYLGSLDCGSPYPGDLETCQIKGVGNGGQTACYNIDTGYGYAKFFANQAQSCTLFKRTVTTFYA